MKDESLHFHRRVNGLRTSSFRLQLSSFPGGRRSQVVRQRSAKPLFIGSIPIAASKSFNNLETITNLN